MKTVCSIWIAVIYKYIMNWRLLLICLYGICFVSCTGLKKEGTDLTMTYEDFQEVKELVAQPISLDSLIWKPVQLQMFGKALGLANIGTEKLVQLLDVDSCTELCKHISVGQGPDEMMVPRFVENDGSSVILSDMMLSVVRKYALFDFLDSANPKAVEEIRLSRRPAGEVHLLGDGYVAPAYNASYLMYVYDSKGELRDSIGQYPSVEEALTDVEKIEMFTFSLATNFHDRVAVFYNWADIIDFYDADGKLLRRVCGPEGFVSRSKEVHNGQIVTAMPDENRREAYYGARAVGDEVWVTFNGKYREAEDYSLLVQRIFVFSWDGVPKRILNLDQGIGTFAVDTSRRIIYGISDTPEFHILSFAY